MTLKWVAMWSTSAAMVCSFTVHLHGQRKSGSGGELSNESLTGRYHA